MMPTSTKLLLVLTFTISLSALQAQDYNPYKSIGKKAKILTGYNGKYVEVFDYDTIQRIGSVLFNSRSRKISKLLDGSKTFGKYSDNSSSSRWYSVDPLANTPKNYSVSPYAFVKDDPILLVDPNGADWFNYQAKGEKQSSWHWQKGHRATYTNAKGKTAHSRNGFDALVSFTSTGKNKFGAETGTLTVYNQNSVALTVKDAFTGSGWWATGNNPFKGGFNDVPNGDYMMHLGDRSTMKQGQPTESDGENPQPNFGIQKIPAGTYGINQKGDEVDINRDYGQGRIRLNPVDENMTYDPSRDNGYYLHGKDALYDRTHGCICDKSEQVFDYFWNGSGKDIKSDVPFSVNVPVVVPN